jgi:hypothetical protein
MIRTTLERLLLRCLDSSFSPTLPEELARTSRISTVLRAVEDGSAADTFGLRMAGISAGVG